LTHDALLYLLLLVAPYFYVLSFNAPFNLKVDTGKVRGFKASLCRLVWPMVIASGLLLSVAAFAFKHGGLAIAIALVLCAAPLLVLLNIPGMVAFGQFYGWDRRR